MSIETRCEMCGKGYRFPPRYAGRVVPCKACGTDIDVPDEFESRYESPTGGGTRYQGNRGSTGGHGLLIGLAIGAGSVLVLGLVAIVVFSGSTADERRDEEVVAQTVPSDAGFPNRNPQSRQPDRHQPAASPSASAPQNRSTSNPATSRRTTPPRPVVPRPGNANWSQSRSRYSLPAPRGSKTRFTFASPVAGFVEIDNVVYETANGKKAGRFEAPLPDRFAENRSLSPDGKLLALSDRRFDEPHVVQVYRAGGGDEIRLTVEFEKPRPEMISFLDNNRLLTSFRARSDTFVIIWDVEKEKELKRFEVDHSFSFHESAVSADGQYLAATAPLALSVYDLKRGRVVAKMARPPNITGLPFAMMSGLAFSPDTKELAGMMHDSRFVVWSAKGTVVFDQKLPGIRGFYRDMGVQWLPDSNGWLLLGQHLLDRESRQVVWKTNPTTFYDRLPVRLIGSDTLAVARGSNTRSGEMIGLSIPWDEVNQALGKVNTEDALVKPGGAVGLEIKVEQVRFSTPDAVRQEFTNVLTQRLANDRISIRPGSEATLRIDYAETAGETKRVVEGIGRRDTGQRIQETKGRGTVSLIAAGRTQPLWSQTFSSDGGLFIEGEISDANVRKRMFSFVLGRLKGLQIPYYIPKDPNAARLPLVSNLK